MSSGGVEEVPRVHDLRHTFASLAAAAGYTIFEVKEMLGHKSIKMTADLYMHLFEDQIHIKSGSLGELMTGASERAAAEVVQFPA
jgi:site-specific recombinase XerD